MISEYLKYFKIYTVVSDACVNTLGDNSFKVMVICIDLQWLRADHGRCVQEPGDFASYLSIYKIPQTL